MTPGDRVEASSLRKAALAVLYQRKLIAWWILQSVVARQDERCLQPGQLLAYPTGPVFGKRLDCLLRTPAAGKVLVGDRQRL